MISIDMTKAKAIAHAIRRQSRDAEFAPHDDVIAKQIPGAVEQAELARQAIRAKYSAMQDQIDAAETVRDLNLALRS